jgi:hypothetical protein
MPEVLNSIYHKLKKESILLSLDHRDNLYYYNKHKYKIILEVEWDRLSDVCGILKRLSDNRKIRRMTFVFCG